MSDAWLLVSYEEGYANTEGPISTWTLEDDYYKPIIVCKTREELVEFLGPRAVWNGDTATLEHFNMKGESKGVNVCYAIPVTFGKLLVY